MALFFAPMILLFALSGALQTFGLDEAKGWGGPPPAIFAAMGNIHKDQLLRHGTRAAAGRPDVPARPPAKPADGAWLVRPIPSSPLPMQIFAVLVGMGLALSTLLGITIALTSRTARTGACVALGLGLLIPAALLLLV